MRTMMLVAVLTTIACGGGAKPPAPEPVAVPDDDEVEPIEEPEPEPEPEPPPPPQEWFAEAALAPIKGSKMKPGTVRFSQIEGEGVRVQSVEPFAGLKAGTYHLVFHEGAECGKNAKGAGKPWPESLAVSLVFTVTKQEPGAIDEPDVAITLDGEASIIGRTLVVHADKKGEPAAAQACGAIVQTDAANEEE